MRYLYHLSPVFPGKNGQECEWGRYEGKTFLLLSLSPEKSLKDDEDSRRRKEMSKLEWIDISILYTRFFKWRREFSRLDHFGEYYDYSLCSNNNMESGRKSWRASSWSLAFLTHTHIVTWRIPTWLFADAAETCIMIIIYSFRYAIGGKEEGISFYRQLRPLQHFLCVLPPTHCILSPSSNHLGTNTYRSSEMWVMVLIYSGITVLLDPPNSMLHHKVCLVGASFRLSHGFLTRTRALPVCGYGILLCSQDF